MKILITGATGLVGKEIGKNLVSQGHEVTVLTRHALVAAGSLPFPAKILEWKDDKTPPPPHFFNDIESVIHLAGESIAYGRWNTQRKKLILDSRVIGTKNIVAAIRASNKSVKQFISASAIGIYGDNSNWVLENSEQGNDFLAQVCDQWEKASRELQKDGIKVINPRIGIVLSRQGGALEKMIPLFSTGLGGVIGDGKQWMSWIHQEDLTNLFCYFVNNPSVEGAFNAVAPNPATNKDFSKILAKSLGKKLFLPVPNMVIKIALGEMSALVVQGQKVSSEKIIKHGFKFKYEHLEKALNDICLPLLSGQKEFFSEVWLPQKVNQVFPFFSDEKNIEKLTPSTLNFHVLKKSTEKMQTGTLIDYKLRIHGVPVRWRTLIESWSPDKSFVDTQLKGPYKLWHHTHEFVEIYGGTLMRDKVKYQLPFGFFGNVFLADFIRSDIEKIFSYRKKIIAQLFGHPL